MTAPLCECGVEPVAGDRCGDCLTELVATDTCYGCDDPGIPATPQQFGIPEFWGRYLAAVEIANGWPAGILRVLPLTAAVDTECFVCRDCVSFCDDCGDAFYDDEAAWACCRSRCDDCGEQWDTPSEARRCCSQTHDYSWSPPTLRFHELAADGSVRPMPDARPGVLFMGVELETEEAAGLLDDWYASAREDFDAPRFVYAKRDGSLSDEGVEFVTMPATLGAFRKAWPWDAFAELNKNGARSWYHECGLHVHVSRSAFDNPQHLARFVLLQYRNRRECVALAGRDSDQWASWDTSELLERGALPDFVKGKRDGARYRALNFTNYATVELRYFRGNLRKAGIMRVLEFVAAAHEYSRAVTTAAALRGALDWPAFAAFIRSNRTEYPYAAHWVANYKKGA